MLTEKYKKKYSAFWAHSAIDRCLLFIEEEQPQTEKLTPEQRWLDLDGRLARVNTQVDNPRYYGDGFATIFTDFGPGSLAA